MLQRMSSSNEELKRENKATSLKLKQIQTTQIKDLNKKLRDRETEIDVLKEMVRSA